MHYSIGLKCMPSNLKSQPGEQPRKTSSYGINVIASNYYIRLNVFLIN